ncbi:hypothetical protein PI124_g13927 [Phytophthora idaei]|nr:hypothetical protein PI124_g13927 [Phytophthora idaei]
MEKIWEVMLGVTATNMIVAEGRSLCRPRLNGWRKPRGNALSDTEARVKERRPKGKDSRSAGENEFKDAAEEPVPAGPTANVAAVKSELKTEPNVKEEHDGGTDAFAGYGDEPSRYCGVDPGQSQMGEYGYGTSRDYVGAKEEVEEEITPQRGSRCFIPRCTGPEARRTDSPAFGLSWSATKWSSATGGYGIQTSGYGPSPSMKTVPSMAKVPKMRGRATQLGEVWSRGVPTQATVASARTSIPTMKQATGPSAGRVLFGVRSIPVMVSQPRVQTGPVRQGGVLNTFSLLTLMSNAMKVLPFFYSETVTVEKARDFWDLFEDHTVGLPDQSQLTFKTLKVERGESVEQWGDRISDLCESRNYPNHQMRYQFFRRGLRNKRMLSTLDASPASEIPEACEWLMFKDMYRPVEEDDEFSDDEPTKKKKTKTPVLVSVDTLAQQLQSFMQQQQQWQDQMTQNRWQGSRSPQNRAPMVAAATASSSSGNGGTAQRNNPTKDMFELFVGGLG